MALQTQNSLTMLRLHALNCKAMRRSAAVRLPSSAFVHNRLTRRFQRPARAVSPRQGNGTGSSSKPADDAIEDPVEAMMRVAREEMGMDIVFSEPHEDEEDYLDATEDLEDVWMRNPSPPEWAEVTGMTGDSAASSSTSNAPEQPGRSIPTISWQELQQQLQDQQQQGVVILEVVLPPGDHQQPVRSLPDPLPWVADKHMSSSATPAQPQHEQLRLQDVTRDVAAAWQDKALVAVLDTGHHSCLAAAIRLTAVYRLPHVVLLQQ